MMKIDSKYYKYRIILIIAVGIILNFFYKNYINHKKTVNAENKESIRSRNGLLLLKELKSDSTKIYDNLRIIYVSSTDSILRTKYLNFSDEKLILESDLIQIYSTQHRAYVSIRVEYDYLLNSKKIEIGKPTGSTWKSTQIGDSSLNFLLNNKTKLDTFLIQLN